MGMPFPQPVIGGGGDLVYPQIRSPNFVHGISGWQIAKDGSAEFQDIIIPSGSGGAVVTFASSAPASPHTGDLWYDTANGLELHQWDGSAWVAFQLSGPAIAAGGVTTTQINFTARDIGGITTSIASTAPAGAKNGDLWYDSSNGYKLNQYESGAWTAYQYGTSSIAAGSVTAALIAANTITAAQIAAGTITATQIAAATITGSLIAAGTITATNIAAGTITAAKLVSGIVVAGIVDATTITAAIFNGGTYNGTDFIMNAAGAFFYSGTPGVGNLIASITTAAVDPFGNTTQKTIASYSGTAVAWMDAAAFRLTDGSENSPASIIDGGGNLTLESPIASTGQVSAVLTLTPGTGYGTATLPVPLNPALKAYKPVTTSRLNTTSMTADPDLVLTGLTANAVYVVHLVLMNCGGAANPGLKWSFSSPSGASGDCTFISENTSNVLVTADPGSWGTAEAVNANNGLSLKGLLIMGSSGGSLTFTWAQNTASASTATKVGLGSYLTAEQIA